MLKAASFFGRESGIPARGRLLLILLVTSLIGLSAFLRAYHIGTQEIWLDEANAIVVSERALPEIASRLKHDLNPPLFPILLHLWMKLSGQSETALRLLSAFTGVLLVACLFLCGKKLFSFRTGIYAALVAALAPIQVMYSQQVRPYTLLPLLSLISIYFFTRFILDGKKSHICLYTAATAGSLYTHNYGLLLLPAHALILLFFGRTRTKALPFLASLLCIMLLYAPWIPSFYNQLNNASWANAWLTPFWNDYGFWGSLLQTLKSFSPGGDQPRYVPLNPLSWQPFWPTIMSSILLLSGLLVLVRANKTKTIQKTVLVSVFLYGTIPLILAGLYSVFFSPIYTAGRCDQLVFPAFCLLVAVGIDSIKPVYVQCALVIVLSVFSLKTLDDYYKSNRKQGYKVMAEKISNNIKPGDSVLCTSTTRAPLEYYLRHKKPQAHFFSYPMENAYHLGHPANIKLPGDKKKLINEAKSLKNKITKEEKLSGRCFLVYVPTAANKLLFNQSFKHLKKNQVQKLGKFKRSMFRAPVFIMLADFRNRGS